MLSLRSLILFCAVLLCAEARLLGQGVWVAAFDHVPNDANTPPNTPLRVHPSSDSIANPQNWITQNPPAPNQPLAPTPHQGMNTAHACLIPSGVHRGEVLVWDGNLYNYGTRLFQPWSIVNPYWPALNPNPWLGQTTPQYRFHNATIALPTTPFEGELFCCGQTWLADGRLIAAGGTKRYPIQTGGGFEGARFVWQWDHVAQTGHPFGRWYQMATGLEVDRWYPTVICDGTTARRAIIIGGTNWTAGGAPLNGTKPVNSYEVARVQYNAPSPTLLPWPNDFDRKPPNNSTVPAWPTLVPIPPASRQQYWGSEIPAPYNSAGFDDYPRLHAFGMPGSQPSPELVVSGFNGWGMHWVHNPAADPPFATALGGPGFDFGQSPANGDTRVLYATSIILPGPIGGLASQVARIGGGRYFVTNNASDLVETAKVHYLPSSWTSGAGSIPPMRNRRGLGNVVILPTGDLFAIGGQNVAGFVLTPELLVGGTTWTDMAAHPGPRDYHATAFVLPDARVFVGGGQNRKTLPGGTDYAIWEPPYFHRDYGSVPPTGIAVMDAVTAAPVFDNQLGAMQYNGVYRATWTGGPEAGIEVNSVVLVRPAAMTHHDDGGQRLVRLLTWQDGEEISGTAGNVVFQSPSSDRQAPRGWWMLFLVTSAGRPSQAYWVNL